MRLGTLHTVRRRLRRRHRRRRRRRPARAVRDRGRAPAHRHVDRRDRAVRRGGVATSGLNVRIWRRRDGHFAHHLLDPSTGRPVWSGLIGATALGDSALEAETLSKMALLLGPAGAREVLAEHGGVIVHDDGAVEVIGPVTGTVATAVPLSPSRDEAGAAAPSTSGGWSAVRPGVLALRAGLAVGDARPGDGREGVAATRLKRAAVRLHEHIALTRWWRSACTGWRCWATTWLKTGVARDRDPVRAGLPAGVHRRWDHRRLSGGAARSELLSAPADRRPAVARNSTARPSLVWALGVSTHSAPAPTGGGCGCVRRARTPPGDRVPADGPHARHPGATAVRARQRREGHETAARKHPAAGLIRTVLAVSAGD